jgi:hypothetical protein
VNTKPRFKFSLRTLFTLVALAAIPLGMFSGVSTVDRPTFKGVFLAPRWSIVPAVAVYRMKWWAKDDWSCHVLQWEWGERQGADLPYALFVDCFGWHYQSAQEASGHVIIVTPTDGDLAF